METTGSIPAATTTARRHAPPTRTHPALARSPAREARDASATSFLALQRARTASIAKGAARPTSTRPPQNGREHALFSKEADDAKCGRIGRRCPRGSRAAVLQPRCAEPQRHDDRLQGKENHIGANDLPHRSAENRRHSRKCCHHAHKRHSARESRDREQPRQPRAEPQRHRRHTRQQQSRIDHRDERHRRKQDSERSEQRQRHRRHSEPHKKHGCRQRSTKQKRPESYDQIIRRG